MNANLQNLKFPQKFFYNKMQLEHEWAQIYNVFFPSFPFCCLV